MKIKTNFRLKLFWINYKIGRNLIKLYFSLDF